MTAVKTRPITDRSLPIVSQSFFIHSTVESYGTLLAEALRGVATHIMNPSEPSESKLQLQ